MKKKQQLSTHLRRVRHPKRRHMYALLGVLIFVVVGYLYANNHHAAGVDRLVTIHDRGQDHVILTHASTVRGALQDAHIAVDPSDDIEPAPDNKLTTTDSAVIIYRARPVLIIDGALREKIMTPAQSPNEIVVAAHMDPITRKDKTAITEGSITTEGATAVLTIKRSKLTPRKVVFVPKPNALTKAKGAQFYTDGSGVTHRETYYDLPMNVVIGACGSGDYTIRSDGAKIDKNGYVLVAASYAVYPRCTVVETSLGPGKVYDTGGFALRYPHGFDLATDWTNYNGR